MRARPLTGIRDAEESPHARERLDEPVDLVVGRVHVGARPRRRGDAERAVQGLRAVVADAHDDAGLVEELADVVGVHPVDRDATSPARVDTDARADDAHAGQRGDALDDARRELGLVSGDLVHADRLEVAHGLGERDRLRYRLRARLEAVRRRAGTRRSPASRVVIVDPPVRAGGSASSSSSRP